MVLSVATEKIPSDTTGNRYRDRLVVQCLNYYTTPGSPLPITRTIITGGPRRPLKIEQHNAYSHLLLSKKECLPLNTCTLTFILITVMGPRSRLYTFYSKQNET